MNVDRLKKPEEAAKLMQMSRATISRNVALGAPVYYISPKRHRYLIDPDEFLSWVNSRGSQEEEKPARNLTVLELAAKRHALVG